MKKFTAEEVERSVGEILKERRINNPPGHHATKQCCHEICYNIATRELG